jgi:glutamate-5-semialdehyde dehydrogenase
MRKSVTLGELREGMQLLMGGNRLLTVDGDLAERFRPGDEIYAPDAEGGVLLVPAEQRRIVDEAVGSAAAAFATMGAVSEAQISSFYAAFAERLADDAVWQGILSENQLDVQDAARRGRSTTRLVASEKLRQGMIEGLRGWLSAPTQRGRVLETVEHEGWTVELVGDALGVVAFVFEGRPNVLADATGVLRGGNTVVFRIGRDALRTARRLMADALSPALRQAGLPAGAVVLVDSAEHASGWALFTDPRVALAVARGSGPAVATLGALARQAGISVSLHGMGGAWLLASEHASRELFTRAVYDSLDRKVCNTLNVCCIVESRAKDLVPVLLENLERAGQRRKTTYKLHVVADDRRFVPEELFSRRVSVERADGAHEEYQAEELEESRLADEWEWENTPEISLKVCRDLAHGVELANRYSPRFVASIVSDDPADHQRFFASVDAPFVGDGFTRWVDGQYALNRPELGLSNWQHGRLFGRGAILSGDGVFTVRTRVRQRVPQAR